MSLVISACGGGGGGSNSSSENNTTTIHGLSQKGPFTQGSTITAYKLNNDGSRDNSNTVSTHTTDNLGSFAFTNIGWTGATEFIASGNYFDENTGLSNNVTTITAIVNVLDNSNFTTNINIFTHLEAQRIKQLMQSGDTIANAKSIAQNFIQDMFSLNLSGGTKLTDLSLTSSDSQNNNDNLELLKISSAISKQSTLLENLSTAIADGVLNSSDINIVEDLNNNLPSDLNTIRQNLQNLDSSITPPTEEGSHNAKPIVADIGNINKTYGESGFEVGLSAVDMNNDTVTFSLVDINQNIATATITNSTITISIKNAGQTDITLSANDGNGGVSSKTFTLVVGQKSATVSAESKSKIYGDSDPVLTYATDGLINGDILAGSLSRDTGSNAGSYNINIGTLSHPNYIINFTPAVLSINKKPITINAEAKDKIYGESDPQLTYTANGLISEDTLSGSITRTSGESAGIYTITQGTLNNTNYNITFTTATFTINKANQNINIGSNIVKTYGDSSFSISPANYSGAGNIDYQSSDTHTASIDSSGNVIVKNAGTTTITVTIAEDQNYKSATDELLLTIGKKPITITANNISKDFGNNDPELTYSVSGLIAGDTLTGTLSRDIGESVGAYTVTQGTLSNENNPNYDISFNTATFTINVNTATIPNLVSAIAGNSKVLIQWNAISNANYNLYYAKETFASLSDIANYGALNGGILISNINTNSATVNSLDNGTTYYFVVTSIIHNIESNISNELNAKPNVALNDTGIILRQRSGFPYDKILCTEGAYHAQDCKFGRDYQAENNNLIKVGLGQAGFDFTKLGANGNPLNDQTQSWDDNGSENDGTRWSCVKDNVTGYIWEVKNNDGTPPVSETSPSVDNIHHKDNKYRWGGITADGYNNQSGNYYNDWDSLVIGANNSNLCGISNWSVPSREDLRSIVNYGSSNPAIDTNFFPNTQSYWYWSSTSQVINDSAWQISFSDNNNTNARNDYAPVRLIYKP
jgi:hypothetical protein